MKSYDVVIVGGGVIGSSIAYHLAQQNLRIALIDKGEIGREASAAAAGLLGVQAEWTSDDPFFEIAQRSRKLFPQLAETIRHMTGIDIGYEQKGIYRVAFNEAEMANIITIKEWQSAYGERFDMLNTRQLLQREKQLNTSLIGGVFCQDDGHVLAPKLTQGLALAASYLQVEIIEYCEVLSILKKERQVTAIHTTLGNIETSHVVIASGAFSNQLLRDFKIDVFPVKGEVIQLYSNEPMITAPIFNERFYIAPKRGGHYILGSTMLENDYSKDVTAGGIQQILQHAFALIPRLEKATFKNHWSGLRPHCTNNQPFIDEHPSIKGLYAAIGHYRNGILLSAVTGELIAHKIKEARENEVNG
ncbi:glycine oxidase ThiO [Kurthia sibirica]|uniref:glycine oxidase n=1 Tax=Kurthia sibirica TaxID=202750 RepID=A0A2U3ALN5_9BACL|nr:glycine oxidase ThiO [Kurthia sibirica]PWI25420.1 glycine oxidase ThiO [Kurthia sibirica]GEK34344.1 glycine oxidase ThiO [Kurthia sibirica]